MNELPESVLEIIKDANEQFTDIDDACDYAWPRIRKLKEFQRFMETLAYRHCRSMVADDRHTRTRRIKQKAGSYGKGSKIDHNRNSAVVTAFESIYDIAVAGKALGNLLGAELMPIAEQERRISDGHLVNAVLLENISTKVKKDKRVRDCITASKLQAEFCKAKAVAKKAKVA